MRIITFNANGLRSAARKGFFDWFARQRADVLCVQNGDAQVLNVDSPNDNKNPRIAEDGIHDCSFEKLSPVSLTGALSDL